MIGNSIETIDVRGERCFRIGDFASLTYLRMRIRGTRKWSHAIIFWLACRFYKEVWF